MRNIQSAAPSAKRKATPNLLPCKIHRDGLIEPIDAYWAPQNSSSEGKTDRQTSYRFCPLSQPDINQATNRHRAADSSSSNT